MKKTLYLLLGQKIRKARSDRDVTQEELSKKLSVTGATISYIEKGAQSVSVHLLYEIAEALGMEIHSLIPTLQEVKNAIPSLDKEIKNLPPKEQRIIKNLRAGLLKEQTKGKKNVE